MMSPSSSSWEQFDYHVLDVLKLLCVEMHKNIYIAVVTLTLMKRYWAAIGARVTINPCILLIVCINIALKLDDAKHKYLDEICSTLKTTASTKHFYSLWMPKAGYKDRAVQLEIPVLRRIRFKLHVTNPYSLIQKSSFTQPQLQEVWTILTVLHASDLVLKVDATDLLKRASDLVLRNVSDEQTNACIKLARQEAKRKLNSENPFFYECLFK